MERNTKLLTVIGTVSIVMNVLTLFVIPFNLFAGYFSERMITILGFSSGAMMFLYLLCSVLADQTVDRQRAFTAWGMSLFTAVAGSVFYGMHLSLPGYISQWFQTWLAFFLLLLPMVLLLVAIGLTARGISGKSNGILYLLATIIPTVYLPLYSLFVLGMESISLLLWFVPPASVLFSVFVILDLLCYRSISRQDHCNR